MGKASMFEWIVGLVERFGYWGVAFLMFLENLVPPIPSEVVMPLAGFTAARGDLTLLGVVIAGTAGSVLGALPWYYAGALLGTKRLERLASRYGRWLTLSPADIRHASDWFARHGTKAVLIGRLVPGVRTLISVPAGIAGMPLLSFLLWSSIGSMIWAFLLALAGHALADRYEEVARYLDPASKLVLGLIVAVYLYRLVTYRPGIEEGKSP